MTEDYSDVESATTVCGSGSTVKGVDVSYYQGTIDWTRVKNDGVRFAFLRVSDGTGFVDPKFPTYWAQTKSVGIVRGAYQYFRPNQDAIAQADLLIAKVGTLAPDDLPPVIDVEADGGLTPAQVAAKVKIWVDRVEGALGVTPIVYTGFYFWRDQVGAPAFAAASPLWHAQYSTAACPNIPAPWTDWAFWQYTDSGSVDGIPGNVDMNRFNGTFADLMALTGGGMPSEPTDPCGTIPATGGVIDDGDACFSTGGPTASMRHVTTAGEGNDLVWTHTTEDATEANFGHWTVNLAAAGTYRVEVYTAAAFAESKSARYEIRAAGTDHEVALDQTVADGWQSLGEIPFTAGGDQSIHLSDNTGELLANKVQLVFDAVRLTPVVPGPDFDNDHGGDDDTTPPSDGGCSTGVGSTWLFGLGLIGLVRRARRR